MKRKVIGIILTMTILIVMLLCCGTASADGGTYDGLDWDLTDGVLTLGKEGETQTLVNKSSRYNYSWPWDSQREMITSVVTKGDLILQGSISYMFYNCSKLTSIDVDLFNTSDVTSMYRMFDGCANLISLDLSSFDTAKVTSIEYMFRDCHSMSYLDMSSMDLAQVSSYSGVFENCYDLVRLKFGEFNPVKTYYGSIAFPLGRSFVMENSDPQIGPYTASELRPIYSADMAGVWVAEDALQYSYAVYDSAGGTLLILESDEYIDTTLGIKQTVTSTNGMTVSGLVYSLNKGRSLSSMIDVGDSVKNIVCLDEFDLLPQSAKWFSGFTACEGMYLAKVDMSKVENCSSLFMGCTALKRLDVAGWDVSQASNMSSMFNGCSALQKLDISSFTFARRPSTDMMFEGCSSLEELDISGYMPNNLWSSVQINFSPLMSLKRIHLGMYPGGNVFGAPHTWSREDGAYGPWEAKSFRTSYGYTSSDSSDAVKARAGWYVRSKEPVIAAIMCPNDNNTLYFMETYDCFGDSTYGTIHRASDGVAYTGVLHWMPSETTNPLESPSWTAQKSSAQNVIVLDSFEPANHSMYYWFNNFQKIQTMDLRLLDVSHVTNMNDSFAYVKASGLVDLRGWEFESDPTYSYMFEAAEIHTLDLTGWDVRKLTNTHGDGYMFHRFNGHLIAPDFHWDSIVSTDVYDHYDFGNMFGNAGGSTYTLLDIPRWSFGHVLSLQGMFYYSYADVNAQDWNLDGVITIDNICRGSSRRDGTQTIDFSGWHSNTLENMSYFCAYSNGLQQVNLSHWDMPALKQMEYMCYYNYGLESIIGFDTWHDTHSIASTEYAFYGCYKLKDIDLSSWDVPGVMSCQCMFGSCRVMTTIDLSGFVISDVNDISSMFSECYKLEYLDISGMDASAATTMYSLFDGCSRLQTVVLGDHSPFQGIDVYCDLPTPPQSFEGKSYSGKWIREDGVYGPFTSEELRNNFTGAMAGTWVWENTEGWYTIRFDVSNKNVVGGHEVVTLDADQAFVIPGGIYHSLGYKIDHWDDGRGNTYADKGLIRPNTYAPNNVVTLTAIVIPVDTSLNMQDGAFDFTLRGGETAFIDNIPTGTAYQVYEQSPEGWTLVAQQDSSGEIQVMQKSSAGFTNQYKPDTISVQLNGLKLVDGVAAVEGSYRFELLNADHELLQTVSVKDGGLIQFEPLEFTKDEIGQYQYYIREIDPNEELMTYDSHEESIIIDVHGGVGETVTRTLHSGNLDDDGNMLRDHGSYELYKGVVSIPGARQLNVHLVHSNVRGSFFLWKNNYAQYLDGITGNGGSINGFTASFNPTTSDAIIYNYVSGLDHELQTEDFVVDGDSLTAIWSCYAFTPSQGYYPDGPYSDMVNYGCYMTVSYTEQELAADIIQDDDGIVFTNVSKPGNLMLSKISGNDITSDSSFVYELQFTSVNGQPYEFPENIVSFETRDGISIDYPDLHRPIEKPKYNVIVTTSIMYGTGHVSISTETVEYEASKTFTINADPQEGYYLDGVNAIDCSLIQTSDTIWKGVMPNHDVHVTIQYLPFIDVVGSIIWDDGNDQDELRPTSVVVHLMADDASVAYQTVEEPWTFTFTDVPKYSGEDEIEYVFQVEDVDGYTQSFDGTEVTMAHVLPVQITITDVTLLSKAEYTEFKNNILLNDNEWWLRSPGMNRYYACYVSSYGTIGNNYLNNDGCCVRPVLICDLGASNLSVGDKISLAGYNWTVISASVNIADDPYNGKAMIFCDDVVGQSVFRTDRNAVDANVYFTSDVKVWLENWATNSGIMPEPDFSVTDVTLLSSEEYTEFKDNIPLNSSGAWWLRSPGSYYYYASSVDSGGSLSPYYGVFNSLYVRPALICDLGFSNLGVGSKISLAGYNWTVISTSVNITDDPYNGKAIILCDDFVGQTEFRTNSSASDANVYDVSDIKVWLATWADTHPFWTIWTKTVNVALVE